MLQIKKKDIKGYENKYGGVIAFFSREQLLFVWIKWKENEKDKQKCSPLYTIQFNLNSIFILWRFIWQFIAPFVASQALVRWWKIHYVEPAASFSKLAKASKESV